MERTGEGLPFRIFCRPLWRVRLGLVRIGGGEEDRGRGECQEKEAFRSFPTLDLCSRDK